MLLSTGAQRSLISPGILGPPLATVANRGDGHRGAKVQQISIDGIQIVFEATGAGEPVVFIHGALIASAFRPLLGQQRLAAAFRLITYHRRGYSDSTPVTGPASIERQAADCRELLRRLSVERAHVVGHSYGGVVALQLALDAPDVVHSLALLEPALMIGDSAAGYRESLQRGRRRFHEAGSAAVVGEFLQARWPAYREQIEAILPGALRQAAIDAGTAFDVDIPELLDWHFGEQEAQRITQPVLSVVGSDSLALSPRFGDSHRYLLATLHDVEGVSVPHAAHFLQIQNPVDTAAALASFFEQHPIETRAT